MKGYWKSPEATERAFWTVTNTGEKWLRKDDMAYINKDDFMLGYNIQVIWGKNLKAYEIIYVFILNQFKFCIL